VCCCSTHRPPAARSNGREKLPQELPVLHIAAEPSAWNTFGNASDVLGKARKDQFNGVQLVGGTHSDAFRSSSLGGLTQLIVGIGTGFSTPENVDAVQVLAQGYIADMYAGTVYMDDPDDPRPRVGVYGTPGTVIDIQVLSPFDRVILALLSSVNANQFVTCPPGAGGSPASCSPALAA